MNKYEKNKEGKQVVVLENKQKTEASNCFWARAGVWNQEKAQRVLQQYGSYFLLSWVLGLHVFILSLCFITYIYTTYSLLCVYYSIMNFKTTVIYKEI